MASTYTGLEVHREPEEDTSTGASFTLKLTGLRVEVAHPWRLYKLSRELDLTVDDAAIPVLSQSREKRSPWAWEVASDTTILTSRHSKILIHLYETLLLKRKAKSITIQGDLVFRRCSDIAMPGDTRDYEHICEDFRVYLSFVAQEDSQNECDPRAQTVAHGRDSQGVQHDPRATPEIFNLCLSSLHHLTQSLSECPSELCTTAQNINDALQSACKLASTSILDEDVNLLGGQVHNLLSYMQQPELSENLVSLNQTVISVLNLIGNVAMFLEDYFKHTLNEDLANPNSRQLVLEDFGNLLKILRSSFAARKDVSEQTLPYTRKQVPMSTLVGKYARNRTEVRGQGRDGEGTKLKKLYDALHPESMPTNLSRHGCLGRTRRDVLSKITYWLNNGSASNVLWLCGAPGTGKTTISWSLIAELIKQQRCAGVFFFEQNKYTPSKLWRTLAYELARFHPALETEIHNAVATRASDKLDLNDVENTFRKLISNPLEATDAWLSSRNPVILIDALEKCKRDQSWEKLLVTISQWPSPPHHCKLIITSLPHSDIAKALENADIERVELLTGDDDDVRTYLSHRFTEMRKQDKSISESWPDYHAISKLVDHTGGLFKWAAVAADSIQRAAGEREAYLTSVIESGATTKFDDFDKYLQEILEMVTGGNPSDAFQAILAMIALSKEPLTMATLELFRRNRFQSSPGFAVSLEDMCYRLLPIVSIEGESKTIKFRHKAYMNYLIDSSRCSLFDTEFRRKTHRKMAVSCLRIMVQGLKFNICRLESSHRTNNEVKNKDALIKENIPSHLSYACQYWADHLRGASTEKRDIEILRLIYYFLESYLLYWLEVLSLLEKSHIASKSLLVAAEWLEATNKNLSFMAVDASRFSFTFVDVISMSAPHIYLSALPFAPPSSLVSKHYCSQFPRTVNVLHDEGTKWPAMRFSISTNSYVNCISMHPNGKKVAAAMGGGTAMIASVTTGEILFNLSGHRGRVRSIAYGPSGKRIATGCDDRRLRIYESENGSLLFGPFELHSATIRSVAWSPDGQRLVTGSDDRRVKVVAAETGKVIYDTAFHDHWVCTVLFTSDFFISGSGDRTVRIYDASTGKASREAWLTGQTGYIRAISISPDGKILAAGSDDCSIVLYDMDKRTMVNQPIRGHTRAVRSLAFSKDGKLLASGGNDYTVRLWNVETGKKHCEPLYGHTSGVSSIEFFPDMKQLVTGGEDCSIRFFDMNSLPLWKNSSGGVGRFLAAIPLDDGNTVIASDGSSISRWRIDEGRVENVHFEGNSEHLVGIRSVSISPNGQLVATAARNRVIIWKVESGTMLWDPLEGHEGDINALNFSADSKMVVSGSDDQKVWVWSAETGKSIRGPMEGHTDSVRGVCFSPEGKQVASGSNDNTAIIWSVATGEKVHEPITHHQDWIYGLAYSPNGLYLATASDDCTVAIWDVATGERVFNTLTGFEGYVRLVNWSPDSKKVVSAALDNVIRIFDMETGILLCEPLTSHKGRLTAISLRPSPHSDEPEIISASLDGMVRVWGLGMKSFVKTQTFSRSHSDWIHGISFSPVNDHLASGGDDGHLVVMDVVSGSQKFSQRAHSLWIRYIAYSSDGKMIATCSDDCMIKVWDADNGKCLLEPLKGHNDEVFCVEFSPDGDFLVSGSKDTTVRTWDLHSLSSNADKQHAIFLGHKGAVNAVAYARGGGLIVSGSASAEIAVWDVNVSDKWIRQFDGHSGPILSIRIFGEKIFSSSEDKTIRIWELSTGIALESILHGHTAPINAITLTPDGNRIVSASDDASLRIFDSDSGKPCTLPLRMSDRMLAVTVSHNGALVACGGADKRVHVWRANMARHAVWPDDFVRKARGLEFCLVDEQGFLADFASPSLGDGWLRGSTNERMFWVPSIYRAGLWTPRTAGILGASETMVDLRKFVHGTEWQRCRAD